ncbi:MAG TPA: hypothetical protein VF721_23790 [Pyrinomonadaceae bacterium]|jgi:hypothetical protein
MKVDGFKPILHIVPGKKSIMQTILPDDGKRPSASEHIYLPRSFTSRQENFYQNLIRLYQLTGSKNLPVYITDDDGNNWRLDRGCIAMAVHDGFLDELKDDSQGVLSKVTLRWVRNKQ